MRRRFDKLAIATGLLACGTDAAAPSGGSSDAGTDVTADVLEEQTQPDTAAEPSVVYEPTTDSLRSHPVPDWYHDAKLGIMIHWGLYSVPGWAPLTGEFDDIVLQPDGWTKLFRENPYAEWYANTIRIDGSPSQQHHAATWGIEYGQFAPLFEQRSAGWKAEDWADVFASAGARYVVMVSKHHDGYCLWPSQAAHPGAGLGPSQRDVVGELAQATRAHGMRFAIYYSGGIDWSVQHDVIEDLGGLLAATPQSPEYVAYANGQWRELIERYRPSYLWNDIGYPDDAGTQELIAWYYNTVADGLINDRFNYGELQHFDVKTEEYSDSDEIRDQKWEAVRGMGYSFGYNRNDTEDTTIGADELVDLLVDVVSKNGNLLINVGPDETGAIPPTQQSRLSVLGQWLSRYGDAIYGTRPWTRADAVTTDGKPVRFTRGGDALYMVLLDVPDGSVVTVEDLVLPANAEVSLVDGGMVEWEQSGADLILSGLSLSASEPAVAFEIRPVPP